MIEDGSLHHYGVILRKLIHGIFASCSDHPSGYALPLTDDDKERARKFEDTLEAFSTELDTNIGQDRDQIEEDDEILGHDEDWMEDDEILGDDEIESERRVYNKCSTVNLDALLDSFHHFIKPFLYPQSTSCSRWDDPLECFVALLSLSSEGDFKAAEQMSQYFAKLLYLMRSGTFYEALHQKNNSTGDQTLEE
jgi:hypothetical protein